MIAPFSSGCRGTHQVSGDHQPCVLGEIIYVYIGALGMAKDKRQHSDCRGVLQEQKERSCPNSPLDLKVGTVADISVEWW